MTQDRQLQLVPASDVMPALRTALAGGAAIAPLPADLGEHRRVLEMLRPDEPLEVDGLAAVLATSGSTGSPKGVQLSRSAIRFSAEATIRRLGGPGEWALALPPHYVAGLMVLARCLVSGATAFPVSNHLSDLPAVVARMQGRRYLSLVPTQLVRALAEPAVTKALAAFDAVLVGGAAADPGLLARAEDAGVQVVTTYGLSETCGGCIYDGIPLDGVEVALETGSERVLLSGPMVFSGYRLRPDLTAAALSDGRLRTADRGQLIDGRLTVLGRVDDVVMSGGLNVDLAEVERACRSWAPQREIVVVGAPDGEWGVRVVAVTDADGSLADLRSYLSGSLPGYAAPRQLVRLKALPRTSAGKVDRQRLVELAGGSGGRMEGTEGDGRDD